MKKKKITKKQRIDACKKSLIFTTKIIATVILFVFAYIGWCAVMFQIFG